MSQPSAPRIALAPDAAPSWMGEAVIAGGGELVDVGVAEGLVWGDPRDAAALSATIAAARQASWVQLPFAGIENFVHLVDDEHTWTCGKGVYAKPVAELALTLALAGMRGLGTFTRAAAWSAPQGENLIGARVSILGGGGITESLVRMLTPFDCHITVVRLSLIHI